ncbi:hypothetical protein [Cupriavidus lacunae]|uniref:hypothetical protein n=1 Tax=Cupriavidus lacunae TaxID=2666307 RepID=UPI001058B078|nr:hypothetical protein [Cupriavidus lacunae]
MFAKLQRELKRLTEARCEEDVQDHAFNFAVTAWHLIDWVWHCRIASDEGIRSELESSYPAATLPKLRANGDPKTWLVIRVIRMCPELSVCQEVANGVKHFTVESRGNVQKIATSATSAPSPMTLGTGILGGEGLAGSNGSIDNPVYRLKITDKNGNKRDAREVFNAVTAFWKDFLARRGML